ncbi:MAG TPA: myo-inosose-2 dehydratase [Victivallales bacterium]|nr:myo-inosose-2 dehydratase [Victivallales bacterium]
MLQSNKVKLGIAPLSWTNDDLPELGRENTFEQCISEMALAGYTGCEVGNKYPKDVKVLRKALELRGIQVCNAWFSCFFTSKPSNYTYEKFIKHRDYLHALGAKVIGVSEQGNSIQGKIEVPVIQNKPTFTDDEWQNVTEGFEELAKLASEKGMTVGVHPHMGTGIQTMDEIDRLMSSTSKNVYLLFDTGHALYSGDNPLELIKKYADRVNHVHLKDVREDVLLRVESEKMSYLKSIYEGIFSIPGDGCINFNPIFKVLEDADYSGWMVVEADQDPRKANPLEYAIKSREFIADKTGL